MRQLRLPVLVVAGFVAAVLAIRIQLGGLDMGLAPCEVVGRSPSQVARMPCAAVVVPDTATYLGRPGLGVESSTADRLGSAVVQSRGLWGRRCQISLHLRLTREVQNFASAFRDSDGLDGCAMLPATPGCCGA